MFARGRPRYPRLALAQAILFTLSVFGAYLHQATARHGYCTHHGELVHLQQHRPRHLDHGKGPVAAPAVDLEGHHGCAVLQFLTQAGRVHSAWQTNGTSCLSPVDPAWESQLSLSSVPLLLQSPKTSPPLR